MFWQPFLLRIYTSYSYTIHCFINIWMTCLDIRMFDHDVWDVGWKLFRHILADHIKEQQYHHVVTWDIHLIDLDQRTIICLSFIYNYSLQMCRKVFGELFFWAWNKTRFDLLGKYFYIFVVVQMLDMSSFHSN